jgi:hypothetical protein
MADDPDRIEARKQIHAAIMIALEEVRVCAGKQVKAAMRFGGNIGILDGKPLSVLNDPRLRGIAMNLIQEHHSGQVPAT